MDKNKILNRRSVTKGTSEKRLNNADPKGDELRRGSNALQKPEEASSGQHALVSRISWIRRRSQTWKTGSDLKFGLNPKKMKKSVEFRQIITFLL